MSTEDSSLFGRIALHYKLISREQLQEVTTQQAREGGQRRLGELLVERGWITPQQLESLLAAQREYLAKQTPAAAVPTPVATPSEPAIGGRARAADRLLDFAVKSAASDIHVHCGSPTRLRVHGGLRELSAPALDAAMTERMARELLDAAQWQELQKQGQVDFAYTLAGVGRFRGNAYRQQSGIDVVLRVILPTPPTLADLGLPTALAKFANFHQAWCCSPARRAVASPRPWRRCST